MLRKSLVAAAVLAGLVAAPVQAHADDYKIDPDHSKVTFKVKHLGISWVPGKFNQFSGSFSFDPKKVADSKVKAEIKASTIDTDNEKRDNHLKSNEFLDSDKFPDITFESTKVVSKGKTKFQVTGDLKIKDVSKPVTLIVEFNGAAKGMQGEERAAFSATATVKRKEFGVTWNKLLETGGVVVGDEVLVTIEIEGIKG